ncbi:MAG: site-specific DNA-methyltransferase [Methanomassiliicoccales archaeon]
MPLVLVGNVLSRLKEFPDGCINVVVTSPPYWGQRDYGNASQIGMERTPEEYIEKMLRVADEIHRVLADDGSYFLNIGDKYVGKNLQMIPFRLAIEMQKRGWALRNILIWHKSNAMPSSIQDRFSNTYEPIFFFVKNPIGYLTPDYYFDLDAVRIPHKTNFNDDRMRDHAVTGEKGDINHSVRLPQILSVEEYERLKDNIIRRVDYNGKFKDAGKINLGASPGARLSVYGEFYSRQRKYKIDEKMELEIIRFIREYREVRGITPKEIDRMFGYRDTAGHWFRLDKGGRSLPKPEDWFKLKDILGIKEEKYDDIMTQEHYVLQTVKPHPYGKNPGDIWDIPTGKLKDAHFAIFPEEIPRRIIMACCPENGIVCDPFAGSGTTLKVARELNRRSIGIELQSNYLKIIRKRCGEISIS